MANANWVRNLEMLALGALLGGLLVSSWSRHEVLAQQAAPQASSATLAADVAHLKDLIPPHSHPMVEVGMFAANLWFAGQKRNWPLAGYYLNEARNRIRWEVQLNPGPKGADGNPVDMQAIFDGIDNGTLPRVRKAIEAKDGKEFEAAYRSMLEDCYSCHKAALRPYLRPMVPVSGAQPIINLDPAATWPQ
ncbi:MAG TPA: hypothetical protein VKT71_03775 [Candidatus Acidoferrales bacterium]|nr:hypothetical protein [Candidatus Acidoferrales bacterium]